MIGLKQQANKCTQKQGCIFLLIHAHTAPVYRGEEEGVGWDDHDAKSQDEKERGFSGESRE